MSEFGLCLTVYSKDFFFHKQQTETHMQEKVRVTTLQLHAPLNLQNSSINGHDLTYLHLRGVTTELGLVFAKKKCYFGKSSSK